MYTQESTILSLYPTLTSTEAQNYIATVSKLIDRYIGYTLASDTPKDFIFDGSGTQTIVLDNPINGSNQLEYTSDGTNYNSVQNALFYPLNDSYTWYVGLRYGKFSCARSSYRIKDAYKGMFRIDWTTPANHTLPSDVSLVVETIIGQIVQNGSISTNVSSGEKKSETTGNYSVTYVASSEDITNMFSSIPSVKNILDVYKSFAHVV